MAEVELKFDLPPGSEAALRNHPELARRRPVEKRLLALYFDTPGQELARHEMALRLRRSGKRWVQGLKAGRSGSGGLHARDEWEFEQHGPSVDLALFADTPLSKLPDSGRLHERLEEIFRVEVRRTTWEIEVGPGQRVELALDRGEVRRDAASEAVSELEIESLEGEPFAVFEVAQRLLGTVPMRPSTVTKARRGYRLLRGETRAPVHAGAAKLPRKASPVDAASAAIGVALDQLQANEEGVLASDDPEYLHQMRSALRRIRSALRVFRGATGRDLESEIRDDIRWLAGVMGEARDWDVLATATLPPLLEARGDSAAADTLVADVAARRGAAHEALRTARHSPRHAHLVLALARWLAQARASGPGRGDLHKLAQRALRKRHGKFMDALKRLSHGDPSQRHRLRIEAKRFRYAVDAFESLYPGKRVKALVRPLRKVQAALGDANDAAVAWRLLASLDPTPALAQFSRGWLGARAVAPLEGFRHQVARLQSAAPFWRRH
jgi:inorganic triphosphatase YgiF